MQRQSTKLRALLRAKTFLHLPSVYDALGGRLVQSLGYEATYVGGYVSGGSSAVTEPLLTMTEQLKLRPRRDRRRAHRRPALSEARPLP
jgi:methylisocitrate lyase